MNTQNNKSYQELDAWKKGIDLSVLLYFLTNNFPQHEVYSLTNQLRRCAVSIPSNIAEGLGRATTKDTLKFLAISKGSLYELETQLIIANRIGYLSNEAHSKLNLLAMDCKKLINGLIKYLKSKLDSSTNN